MTEYLHVLRTYAVFQGRARRREFWMFTLVHNVILLALWFPIEVTVPRTNLDNIPAMGWASLLLYLLYTFGTLVPSIALTVRRLHDTGRSSWFFLLFFVPVVGFIILLIFAVTDGEPGANRWGPNPKALKAPGTGARAAR